MQGEKKYVKISTIPSEEHKTEDNYLNSLRTLVSDLGGMDCRHDGYLADRKTREVFEVRRNPETEVVEGFDEYQTPSLHERLEAFYGRFIIGIHMEGVQEVDTGNPVGGEVW